MRKSIVKKIIYISLVLKILLVAGFLFVDYELNKILGGSVEHVDASSMITTATSYQINNVNILSEDCKEFIPAQNVLIENGTIKSISDSTTTIKTFATVIDGTGKYLIPGLVDSHVHLFESKNDLLLYLVNGITYIREMKGSTTILQWKEEIKNGGIGPRMFVSSPSIYSEEGLKGYYTAWTRQCINYTNEEDARKEIKQIKERGYDAIKMYGFVNREMFEATIKIAKEYSIPVLGHIPNVDLDVMYTSGQKEIAHIEELIKKTIIDFGSLVSKDPDGYLKYLNEHADEIAIKLKENDISVQSTMWLMESFIDQSIDLESILKKVHLKYANAAIVEGTIVHKLGWLPDGNRYKASDNVLNNSELRDIRYIYRKTYAEAMHIMCRALIKHNVIILAGTDSNVPVAVPGFSLHRELESLNNSGMTNAQTLYAATVAPNESMKSNSGKIKVGFNSDLVLLSKNPLEDIKHTRSIENVFFNKRMIDKIQIGEILKAIEEANEKSRTKDISKYLN